MSQPLTAVFDIGKTNKKFFLFDAGFREVHREYSHLPLTRDEDGHPTEDLPALVAWMRSVLETNLKSGKYDIRSLNFSSYGASLVHLDAEGRVITPLYNYTKAFPEDLASEFYHTYGPEPEFSRFTGSSPAGMLNSGLQLYWLKKTRPELFRRIACSLHLPQYLSYIFTGKPVSDYTSIGCHTALWDYRSGDYHAWVSAEGIRPKLAPVVPTTDFIEKEILGRKLRIGVGIHDSSAALLPYLESIRKPFVLLSTGTWSIALNPFSDGHLAEADRAHDCINYMRTDGSPVKASRLFLGNEFKEQLAELNRRYGKPEHYYHDVAFDPGYFRRIKKDPKPAYRWKSLDCTDCPDSTQWAHESFEGAYHQLVYELCLLQERSLRHVIGDSGIRRLYIDGGFSRNEVFLETLAQLIRPVKIRTTDASLGSALGAAIAVSGRHLEPGFLKEHYDLKKHKPLILS